MTESRAGADERRPIAPPPKHRARGGLSVALIVLASLVAVAGGVTLWVREEIVDSSAFADRAVSAMRQPTVQRVVAREITAQVIEPAVPDVLAARPVVQSAVKLLLGSRPFAPVIRLAALHGHRLLFERHGRNAVFDIADAGTVVDSVLGKFAPRLARDIPRRAEVVLTTLKRRSFAADTLRIADAVRLLGIVFLPAAVLLFGTAVVVAPDRRKAITRSAVAVGVSGVALAVALELVRRYVVAHSYGANELSNADVRGAVDELWGVYLGGLMTWGLVLAAVAWVVAAASAPWLAPYSGTATLARLRMVARPPGSDRIRAARGALALALGLFAILQPSLAFRALAVLGGCALVYVGLGEVLSATAPVHPRARRARSPRPRRVAAVGGFAVVVVAVIALILVLTGGASSVQASAVPACNGYPQLCDRRLDEVVFAGTHNSMSAADSPGWLIANQDRTVSQQLQDGIRLFKISSHYGVATTGGVYTDIAAEGRRLNRVAAQLSPAARAALQRLSRSLTGGKPKGTRDIWLCHTLCELGATRMVDYLTVIRRFLELNPNQVIILFDEDYVAEHDLKSAFKRAGLFRYLARLQPGEPLPTLASLIRSHHNVVVFAQNPTSGKYAWNAPGFSWVQDTPLGARKPAQFTCKPNRGSQGNSLLMMNDWADIFPPRPSPNVPLVQRAFILKRARQCINQRGRMPNLILTDYYDRGGVIGAVAELNGVAGQRAVPPTPVERAR